jgi:Beta protein
MAKLPAGMRRPNFGDYTVVHPDFTPMDMRKIKSAGKVIYTTPRNWFVRKGGAFRDNPAQMHDHCADLVKRPIFKGAGYSSGDDYIAKCAVRKEGPSIRHDGKTWLSTITLRMCWMTSPSFAAGHEVADGGRDLAERHRLT